MKRAAYAVGYGVACFAGIFVLVFAFFWLSELFIPNRQVDFGLLVRDSFSYAVRLWIAAMIVSAVGFCVKNGGRRKSEGMGKQ